MGGGAVIVIKNCWSGNCLVSVWPVPPSLNCRYKAFLTPLQRYHSSMKFNSGLVMCDGQRYRDGGGADPFPPSALPSWNGSCGGAATIPPGTCTRQGHLGLGPGWWCWIIHLYLTTVLTIHKDSIAMQNYIPLFILCSCSLQLLFLCSCSVSLVIVILPHSLYRLFFYLITLFYLVLTFSRDACCS